jgi:hypothetical protein
MKIYYITDSLGYVLVLFIPSREITHADHIYYIVPPAPQHFSRKKLHSTDHRHLILVQRSQPRCVDTLGDEREITWTDQTAANFVWPRQSCAVRSPSLSSSAPTPRMSPSLQLVPGANAWRLLYRQSAACRPHPWRQRQGCLHCLLPGANAWHSFQHRVVERQRSSQILYLDSLTSNCFRLLLLIYLLPDSKLVHGHYPIPTTNGW